MYGRSFKPKKTIEHSPSTVELPIGKPLEIKYIQDNIEYHSLGDNHVSYTPSIISVYVKSNDEWVYLGHEFKIQKG
jgi:hypothetical protein